jgi:hypothetical protein
MANIKQAYQYDPNTKEFINIVFAQESPLEPGVWLIPPNTTEMEPPEVGQYQKQVFNKTTNQWEIKPDYRNAKVYSTASENIGQEIKLDLGQELINATLIQPPQLTKYYEELKWENNNWVIYNNPDKAMELVRQIRNKLLSETDWLILRHQDEIARGVQTTLTAEQYQELLTYRQELRDLPENPNLDVFNPQFPQKPSWMK